MVTASTTKNEVDGRWQGAGSGEHYVSDRWGGQRARERDPRLVQRLLRALPTGAEVTSILDVPCGTGRLAGVLRAPFVVQSDISMSMLQNIPDAASRGHRLQSSAIELPFSSDSFDVVICCRLLHHLRESSDRQAVLNELVRVSRRYVIASYWDAASYGAWRRRTNSPLRRRKRPDVRQAVALPILRAELEAAGARLVTRAHSFRFVSQQAFLLAEK